MGIRHLTTSLRPYATLESLSGRTVVIDGPSFAHQIYYICLRAAPRAKNAFEAAPSYRELGEVAIAWLDGLRGSNVEIKGIYFDGFLPPSKLEVRLKRLRESTVRLSTFHAAYTEPCNASSLHDVSRRSLDLFRNQTVSSRLTTLPALPFLVPAILEALKASGIYREITETVPGEADLYCAKYLKLHGGIVLTSDSDLLVHDLGSKGTVSFFSDIKPVGEDAPEQLRTQILDPVALSGRFNLHESYGLISLAFEMHMDQHGTFPSQLSKAQDLKAITQHPQMFSDFLEEYTALPDDPSVQGSHAETFRALRCLDPRTSEYVLQFHSLAILAGQSFVGKKATSVSPHVFLPFLLDCPIRMTAWGLSTFIRQLAYGLVNLIVPQNEQVSDVFEHRKQIEQSQGRNLAIPSLSEISEACTAISNGYHNLHAKLPKMKESEIWIAVALQQNIDKSDLNIKTPTVQLFNQTLGELERSDGNVLSWNVIQFFAQLQASLYSLRMLKQISAVVIAVKSTETPNSVLRLSALLESLPALIDYPDLRSAPSKFRNSETADFLGFVKQVLRALEYDYEPAKESKASKKKRIREQANSNVPASKSRSSNPFDVLRADL